jgi:carbamoyltransferase
MPFIYVVGISAYYHDSAAALTRDGEIVSAAHEERFTRKKHDASFPSNALRFLLEDEGIGLEEVDKVIFYDKPFIKFERLLETYHAFAPRGLKSFLSAIPVWIKEKLFLKKFLRDELEKLGGKRSTPILFSEHHLSHAASAFYPSPFEEAAILTVDGVGEWATATIGYGKNNQLKVLRELHFPHSIGLLYAAFTYYLGFKVNSGEYKLMGLAPYGNSEAEQTKQFIETIRNKLVDIRNDGSFLLNMKHFNYATGLTMVKESKWQQLFGMGRRKPSDPIQKKHMNLALAIQVITEEIILKMAQTAKELTGCNNLAMAGGVALNSVANGKLLKENLFEDIWVQPSATDAGAALGAALSVHYIFENQPRNINPEKDRMKGAYLGPSWKRNQLNHLMKRYNARYREYDQFEQLARDTANFIAEGKIVGWFQGRMEFGPRALGNRSILADARNPNMQKKLNLRIKYREGFRPFAPSVLEEDAAEYFDIDRPSPYMLFVVPVQEKRRLDLPEGFADWELLDKLYVNRSDLPGITHVDYSARIQTVCRETNPVYWKLINEFKKLTGYGVIINTSFNVRGEPIVCSPEEAYRCFMNTQMDYLVIGNCLFDKKDQEKWEGMEQSFDED